MTIENLRTEVRRQCDLVVRYIRKEDAKCYCLSIDSPANTMNNCEVNVLDCIPESVKIQAEAHELGHIYIRENGLVSLEPLGDGFLDFFILELNNALSHRFVIDTLSSEFSISSSQHLKLRAQSISLIPRQIKDCQDEAELLHGIGLRLYDICLTIPQLKEEAERLARTNRDVYAAFSAANTQLQIIRPDMPGEEQESVISGFLSEFGYRPELFL